MSSYKTLDAYITPCISKTPSSFQHLQPVTCTTFITPIKKDSLENFGAFSISAAVRGGCSSCQNCQQRKIEGV
jgi:hypothetical protein